MKTQLQQFSAAQRNADKKSLQAKSVEQPDIIRQVFHDLKGDYPLEQIQAIIMAEQAAVTKFLTKGYRVSQYGYMTYYTSKMPARNLKCPIDGKNYDIPEVVRVNVRIGEVLKRAVQSRTEFGAAHTAANATPGDKNVPQAARKTFGKEKGHAGRIATISPERGQNSQTAESLKGGDRGVGTGA